MSDLIERAKREAQLGVMSPSQAMLVHDLCTEVATLEAKLAVAREALEPVRDFLIHEVGFEDDDEPLTAILRALKELDQ